MAQCVRCTLTNRDVVPTRRDILLLLSCFLLSTVFGNSNAIHVVFRRIACPKSSTNNCIVQQFACFFCCYLCFFWGLWASGESCSPTAEDANERKASCSPPQWGGGELRDSESRKYLYNIFGQQPAGLAQWANANSGPPLAGGCGPRGSSNRINSRALANPAAGTISDKGRLRRRSVKSETFWLLQKCRRHPI